jgi:serine kinase of HPr protein (carbohydrate metabolism regulator)
MSGVAMHASAVLIGEAGVLILGASGMGKSTLARRLIGAARDAGLYAGLIGDDRILIEQRGAALIGRPHPAIAGKIEVRGEGIVDIAHEPAAILRLAVDIAETVERMPADAHIEVAGVRLRRIFVTRNANDAAETVIAALLRL